jgi:glycosyltransferase involved in cell wall biosynthesis
MKIAIVAVNIYFKDAIGNFCHDLADTYHKQHHEVMIFAEGFDQNSCVMHYNQLFSNDMQFDVLFYHHSIYEPHLEKILNVEAHKKIVYFHGITPPEFLEKFEPVTADFCQKGIAQLPYLSVFDVVCVNSMSSAKQLEKHIPNLKPVVIPPIVSSRQALQKIVPFNKNSNKKTILSVGRVVPHKKIEDTILLLSAFIHKHPTIDVELKIVGTFPETDYYRDIQSLIDFLQLREKIIFEGFVADEALVEHYMNADCFVLMSEHEGFGVPLLEALKANIPILAYNKNAVAEVLGNSGCQITEKNPDQSADLLYQILTNTIYKNNLLEKQKNRLEALLSACDEKVFVQLLDRLATTET